jgi:hypothetical protein
MTTTNLLIDLPPNLPIELFTTLLDVLFEGFPPIDPKAKSPICLEGARACPPEDCGGPWGYAEYLAAIADPQHEEHEEMLEWRGPFDPEVFDANQATKEMKKVK